MSAIGTALLSTICEAFIAAFITAYGATLRTAVCIANRATLVEANRSANIATLIQTDGTTL
jgi:hypothetical protein